MSDTFRKEYKQLDPLQKDSILMIKEKAEELLDTFESLNANMSIDARSMALAKTNLEQSVMWAVKAIT